MPNPSPDSENSGDLATNEPTSKRRSNLPLPSDDPTTNLLIAEIAVRGASTLFRESVEKRVANASAHKQDEHAGEPEPREMRDGRTLITTLGLYGASKLATRSVPGLLIVTGGLLAKTLYDRGKARQRRLSRDTPATEAEIDKK